MHVTLRDHDEHLHSSTGRRWVIKISSRVNAGTMQRKDRFGIILGGEFYRTWRLIQSRIRKEELAGMTPVSGMKNGMDSGPSF